MKKICKEPFTNIEVHMDGSVYTCCPRYINGYKIGNIYQQDFEEIWNSVQAQNLREKILKEDYSVCDMQNCSSFSVCSDNSDFKCRMEKYPQVVKFCHDKECNINCITCRKNILRNSEEENAFLDSCIETKFLPILKDAHTVILNGAGDVLASRHGKKLIEAINKKYPGMKFGIHTNGTLCSEAMLKKLNISDKTEQVQISLHAASKETYEKICKNSNWDKIFENMEYLSGLKNNGQLKIFQFLFVIESINYKEMPEFVKLGQKYGAEVCFWEYEDWGCDVVPYEELAVFNIEHPNHESFIRIMQNPLLKEKNVILNKRLEEFTNIKDVDSYLAITHQTLNYLKRMNKKDMKSINNLFKSLKKYIIYSLLASLTFGKMRKKYRDKKNSLMI